MRVHASHKRCHPAGGFTLVEVLVTLAIMSMIMMGLHVSLHSAIFSHDDIALEIAQVRNGPRILDLIERDVRALHGYNIKGKAVIQGELERHLGTRGDRFDLLTGVNSATRLKDPGSPSDEPRWMASDLTEVGYRTRPRPDQEDFLELFRREDLYVDEEPLSGGRFDLLHDRVTKFEITYYDALGEDAEEFDEWKMEERKELPAAIRVHLALQTDPRLVGDYVDVQLQARQIMEYTRVIAIPPVYNQMLDVRPAKPVPIDENEVDLSGDGGGEDNQGAGGGGPDGPLIDGGLGGPDGDGLLGGGGPGDGNGGFSFGDQPGGGGDVPNLLPPPGGLINSRISGNDPFAGEGPSVDEVIQDLLDQYESQFGGGG